MQGSKIALVRSYLRVPQAAGQVKILIFLVKIKFFSMYANILCDAGQVPILRYFEAWHESIKKTQDRNNTYDPQKKYRLGTVSKNILKLVIVMRDLIG